MQTRYVRRKVSGLQSTTDKIIEEHVIDNGDEIISILTAESGLKYQIIIRKIVEGVYSETIFVVKDGRPNLIRKRTIDAEQKRASARSYVKYIEEL